jgi:bifunctional polynucleotide phosphatase/kinase
MFQVSFMIANAIKSNPESRERLPEVAFHHFASRFKEPQLEEGFQEIIKVDFEFIGSDEAKAAWKKYWV